MKASNYPITKILFPFILGIFCAYLCHYFQKNQLLWFILTINFWLFSLLCLQIKRYKLHWIRDLALTIGFIFAGISCTNFHLRPLTQQEQKMLAETHYWRVRIVDFPVIREKSVKIVTEILDEHYTKHRDLHGKGLLYLERCERTELLAYGDILFVAADLSEFSPPTNPDAFNNQQYMRRKGILFSSYVSDPSWQKVGHRNPNIFKSLSRQWQKRLATIFDCAGMSGAENEIIKAILLGDDDTMEPELRASYASAGVSHILCVSGMHVGIIFMIINFLLKPLDYSTRSKKYKSAFILTIIWLYAGITGMSPSVTRSATMFSFVTIGSLIQRNTNIFHSLFASLFILLVYNPLLLFEVGFQFSYLAVFGIVLFQPRIVAIYHCKTRIGQYFWEMAAVSIAAQLSTFPLSIHYFGQFPNYFLLSNLSVMSLSFIVMVTGIILLVFSFVPFLTTWLSKLLTLEIKLMNGIIVGIQRLPGAVTHNIDYSMLQVLLLYSTLFLFLIAITRRKRAYFWASYAMISLFSFTFCLRKIILLQQQETLVYDIRKATAIYVGWQQQGILFSDTIQSNTDQLYNYAIGNHARRQHAKTVIVPLDTAHYEAPFAFKQGHFLQANGKSFYLLNRKERLYAIENPILVDVLFLRNNPSQKPEEVAKAIYFQSVIADGSNSRYTIDRWQRYCNEHNIAFENSGERDARRLSPGGGFVFSKKTALNPDFLCKFAP